MDKQELLVKTSRFFLSGLDDENVLAVIEALIYADTEAQLALRGSKAWDSFYKCWDAYQLHSNQ